jgi:hypothetical protein
LFSGVSPARFEKDRKFGENEAIQPCGLAISRTDC